jgi:hypothetical protein
MTSFLRRFGAFVSFVLAGFDRLRFRGESRRLNNARGLDSYLYQEKIRYVDFRDHCKALTERLREQSERLAQEHGVPIKHLNSPNLDKEATARALAAAQPCSHSMGQIALLTCVESCNSYRCRKNAEGRSYPVKEHTRCRHDYHYFQHPELGLCYVRIQTYFPFTVRVGLNGRQWLYQQLRKRGVEFTHQRNLLMAVKDPALAQQLLDAQVQTDYVQLLNTLVQPVQPLWQYLQEEVHTPYYWTCEQSEWANDLLFRSRQDLARWYPRWLRHAVQTLQCQDVLRFMGLARLPQSPQEVKIDLAPRVEGSRVKFWVGVNSLKLYDKESQSLRPEHTINQPGKYKAFRTAENDPQGEPSWRPLRKGVADMAWRAEIGQAVNNRLLESLATVTDPQTLGTLLKPLGEPVFHQGKRRARALNPLTGQDGALIRLLAQGKYLVEGFRNADLRAGLFGEATDFAERKRQSARTTRLLALLRAHGVIVKVPKSHRYQLSALGRRIATALRAAHNSDVDRLTEAA